MKKYINNLVVLLCIISVALLSMNYQASIPRADAGVPAMELATDTDSTTECTTTEQEGIVEDNSESTTEEFNENTEENTTEESNESTEESIVLESSEEIATSTDAAIGLIATSLNTAAEEATENSYDIASQADWNNLFNGTTNSANWTYNGTNTTYVGDLPIVINVNSDISGTNTLIVPQGISVTINFNNNNWSNGEFSLNNGSLIINNAQSSAMSINATGCTQVDVNDAVVDMISNTSSLVNLNSPTIVNLNNCTVNNTNNYVVASYANSTITVDGCTIDADSTILITPINGSLNVIDSNISTTSTAINAIDIHSGTGDTTISGCSFSNFEKAIFVGANTPAQNPSDISITDSNFYNCKFGIDFQKGNATSIKIANCDFTLDSVMDGSAAIVNKYCFAIGGSEDLYTYENITITNYDTGMDTSYGSGITVYNNCDINNCLYGITSLYNTYTVIRNCDIVGRQIRTGTYGIKVYDSASFYNLADYSSVEEYANAIKSQVTNCSVKNSHRGVVLVAGCVHIYQTDISNCNSGVYTENSGTPFVNECEFIASSVVDSNSYGVYASPSGGMMLNSVITGFNIGAFNQGGALPIAGCKFTDNTTGVHLYCTFIYGSEITGSDIGFLGNSDSHIISCKFIGDGTGSGVVIDSAAINLVGTGEYMSKVGMLYERYTDKNKYASLMDAVTLVEVFDRNEISNFEIGIEDVKGFNFDMYDTYIHDCGIGLKTTYMSLCENNEIAKCDIGIEATGNFYSYAKDTTSSIHDCGTGIKMSKHFYNSGSQAPDFYHFDIHDCDIGIHAIDGAIIYAHNDIHDNKTGLILESGNYNYASLYLHNNSEKDLDLRKEATLYTYADSMQTRIINNSDTALSAIIDGAGTFKINPSFVTGAAPYHLTEGSYVRFETPELEGCMTFDVPDYVEGRKVAETSFHFYNSLQLLYNYQLRAKAEGWVVTMDMMYDEDNPSGVNYYLTGGCEVSYDYATNGGQSMSPLYTKYDVVTGEPDRPVITTYTEVPAGTAIPYKKGESIDLTPIANKAGYKFVGWNTDPNATVGLTELEADIKNVTLYAIYKKTNTVTYKTYSSTADYSVPVDFYNNNQTASTTLDNYVVDTPEEYIFSGYKFNGVEYSEGDSVNLSLNDSSIYCLYKLQGELIYFDSDATELKSVICERVYEAAGVENREFSFTLEEQPVKAGYIAKGWLYGTDILQANDTINTAEYSISVKAVYEAIKVQSLEVVPEAVTMKPGGDTLLLAKVLPEDALNKRVVWRSENTDIATVDDYGNVYAKADGVVKIWATTTDGSNLSDYSLVTVETPKERTVTVTGVLTYPSGQAVANKTVTLKESVSEALPYAVIVPNEYSTNTDQEGHYSIYNVPVGDYTLAVSDANKVLATCIIKVASGDSASDDKIAVIETNKDASVDYNINNDVFIINVAVAEDVTTETTTEITTEQPSEPEPKTGDSFGMFAVIVLMLISVGGIIVVKFKKA